MKAPAGRADSAERVRGFILQPTYRIESGRPVVQPVLDLLNLDFDRVIGDDRLLGLWG